MARKTLELQPHSGYSMCMNMHPKLLLVEDEEVLRRMYVKKLMSESFDVLEAGDGNQALTHAKNDKPDLILLDVMLPGGMNGFDILEILRRDEGTKNIPVIMLTNLSSEEETAKTIGVQGYFVKANTSLDDLVTKIKEILAPVGSA